MNLKSKEYNLIKILLSFYPLMSCSEAAVRLAEIRSRYAMAV
jgi:hypothetical protein